MCPGGQACPPGPPWQSCFAARCPSVHKKGQNHKNRPKNRQKRPKIGPKMSQSAPKMSQSVPKVSESVPKITQCPNLSPMTPKRPNLPQRCQIKKPQFPSISFIIYSSSSNYSPH